jgi:uncharacterized protein (TIGR02217 family)
MFLETPRFPENISRGAVGGPGFSTSVVTVVSGREKRLSRRPFGLCAYDVSHGVRDAAQMAQLVAFFRIAQGRSNGFRFKDWLDFTVAHDTGRLGSGNGTGGPVYQLGKRYAIGSEAVLRPIEKPVAGQVAVQRNGSPVAIGSAPGNVAIATTTGVATFVADATSSATSITAGATTTVALSANPGALIAGQLLHLSGFAGADAALVNNLPHLINSVSGSGPFTFVLATNTAGATITLGSGLGARYPQVADALTWAGAFDVPCRFNIDQMQVTMSNASFSSWESIPVVEVLDGV